MFLVLCGVVVVLRPEIRVVLVLSGVVVGYAQRSGYFLLWVGYLWVTPRDLGISCSVWGSTGLCPEILVFLALSAVVLGYAQRFG